MLLYRRFFHIGLFGAYLFMPPLCPHAFPVFVLQKFSFSSLFFNFGQFLFQFIMLSEHLVHLAVMFFFLFPVLFFAFLSRTELIIQLL
jgi:hypothetical protein